MDGFECLTRRCHSPIVEYTKYLRNFAFKIELNGEISLQFFIFFDFYFAGKALIRLANETFHDL